MGDGPRFETRVTDVARDMGQIEEPRKTRAGSLGGRPVSVTSDPEPKKAFSALSAWKQREAEALKQEAASRDLRSRRPLVCSRRDPAVQRSLSPVALKREDSAPVKSPSPGPVSRPSSPGFQQAGPSKGGSRSLPPTPRVSSPQVGPTQGRALPKPVRAQVVSEGGRPVVQETVLHRPVPVHVATLVDGEGAEPQVERSEVHLRLEMQELPEQTRVEVKKEKEEPRPDPEAEKQSVPPPPVPVQEEAHPVAEDTKPAETKPAVEEFGPLVSFTDVKTKGGETVTFSAGVNRAKNQIMLSRRVGEKDPEYEAVDVEDVEVNGQKLRGLPCPALGCVLLVLEESKDHGPMRYIALDYDAQTGESKQLKEIREKEESLKQAGKDFKHLSLLSADTPPPPPPVADPLSSSQVRSPSPASPQRPAPGDARKDLMASIAAGAKLRHSGANPRRPEGESRRGGEESDRGLFDALQGAMLSRGLVDKDEGEGEDEDKWDD